MMGPSKSRRGSGVYKKTVRHSEIIWAWPLSRPLHSGTPVDWRSGINILDTANLGFEVGFLGFSLMGVLSLG